MIRKIAVLKTTYLALVWLAVTVFLPLLAAGYKFYLNSAKFIVNRLFLIFPICVLFDYRDREEDRREGIKNIATLISARGLDLVFGACVLLGLTAAVIQQMKINGIVIALCNTAPYVLLVLTYRTSKATKSDLWFYLYLDGLMMLSGLMEHILNLF